MAQGGVVNNPVEMKPIENKRCAYRWSAVASLAPTRFLVTLLVSVTAIFMVVTSARVAADQAPRASKIFGLVVVGLGGNSDYSEMFEEAASSTLQAVNPPPEATDAGDTQTAANAVSGLDLLLEHETSREEILNRLSAQIELANQHRELNSDASTRFMLMFFGHGSYDGEHYRFNNRGPDITGEDIVAALQPLQSGQQFVMFATSASGAVLEAFDAKTDTQNSNLQRVVITATKSGAEANAVQFPRFWSDVLTGQLADTDHNELLTVLEAYEAATDGVVRYYDNASLLATEHSRVSSNDAANMVLARLGSLRGQENNAVVNDLLGQRQQLELEFNKVRSKRDTLAQSDYLDELESVLLQIARLQLQIDEATGWQPEAEVSAEDATERPEEQGDSGTILPAEDKQENGDDTGTENNGG